MTTTSAPLVDAQAPADNRQMINAIIASLLGWSLDLFDLFILLYVAPVIGTLFFPSTNATLSLAAVYASFAVTLLMRPIGSAIFGHFADVHGRKGAMLVAIVGVGVSTAALLRRRIPLERNRFPRTGAGQCRAWWAAVARASVRCWRHSYS